MAACGCRRKGKEVMWPNPHVQLSWAQNTATVASSFVECVRMYSPTLSTAGDTWVWHDSCRKSIFSDAPLLTPNCQKISLGKIVRKWIPQCVQENRLRPFGTLGRPEKLWRQQRRGCENIRHFRQHLSLAGDLGTSPRPPIEPPEDRLLSEFHP